MSHHTIFPARLSTSKQPNSNNKCASSSNSIIHRHKQPHLLRLLILITIFLSLVSSATATEVADIADSDVDACVQRDLRSADLLGSTLARLARSGTIITDPRPRPIVDQQRDQFSEIDLQKRSGSTATESESTSTSTSSVSSAKKSTTTTVSATSTVVASSTTSSGIVAATTQASSALPSPFDTSLGSNFTNTACPAYIRSFIADEDFKTCLPFSLLLQSSNSFFQAEKSVVRVTQTLDHSCSANSTFCTTLLSQIATNLSSTAICGPDLTAEQPLVVQAYTGLIAYAPLYTASCLRNPSTSAYCFADAITNASSPTDAYIYYLPLNVSLPGGSQPTCSTCLKNTMAVYEAASANRSQAIYNTYTAAAQQVNMQCGPSFVNASVATVTSGGVRGINSGLGAGMGWVILVMTILLGGFM